MGLLLTFLVVVNIAVAGGVYGSTNISLGMQASRLVPSFEGTENGCAQSGSEVSWSSFFGSLSPNTNIVVPCGKRVVLDEEARIPRLGLLQIDGYLIVPSNSPSRTIEVANMLIQGQLLMGDSRRHIQNRITFKVVNSGGDSVVVSKGGQRFDLGTKAIVVAGGQMKLYGMPGGDECMQKTWARLETFARKGSKFIQVDRSIAGCWKVGHEIGISPSYTSNKQHDIRRITGITGNKIFLDLPLTWDHTGDSESFRSGSKTIRYTTEVGLLTRNIVFDSEVDGPDGMHTIVSMTRRAQSLYGVEFVRGGQQGKPGRYPVHFHLSDNNQGSVVKACSIHKSMQRGIIIHGTDNVKVESNVLFQIMGHGIGFEDGIERNNLVKNNLIVGGRRPQLVFKVDNIQESDFQAGCIWMRGPGNSIIGNVAVGCHFGYWYELDSKVRGLSQGLPQAAGMNPRKVKVPEFQGNTARGGFTGLSLYPDGMDLSETSQTNVFSDSFFYMMKTGIFAHNSENLRIERTIISDTTLVGIDLDRLKNAELRDSLIIGQSPFSNGCPSKYGLELHPIRGLTNVFTPTIVDKVDFDRFQDCGNAPISIGNEDAANQGAFNRQQSLPASTTLRRIQFLDNPTLKVFLPQSKEDIPDSLDSDWTSHIAIHVEKSPQLGDGEGFLISSNNEALRPRSNCITPKGHTNSLFCPKACYRTLEFQIKTRNEQRPGAWDLRLTRKSDGRVDYLKHPTWGTQADGTRLYSFFGNVVGGEEYLVTPTGPSGRRAEPYLSLNYEDGAAPACTAGVKIVFSQANSTLAPTTRSNSQPAFERPCSGSVSAARRNEILFFDRCDAMRGAEIVVELPSKFRLPILGVILSPPRNSAAKTCMDGIAIPCL